MKTQNEAHEVPHNSAYNPFPEPQTIPSGWDLSGLISTPEIDTVAQVKASSKTESN